MMIIENWNFIKTKGYVYEMKKIMKNKKWIPCYRDSKKNDFVLKLRTLEDLKRS